MGKENIQLYMLSGKGYDVMVSPMSMSYIPSESDPDTSQAHRHDYYSLFLLEKGSVTMFVDNQYVAMSGPSALLVCPGQVHHPLEMSDIKGWVMIFDGKMLDAAAVGSLEQSAEEIYFFNLVQADFAFLDNCLSGIHITAESLRDAPFSRKLLQAMVNTVYFKLANIHWSAKTGVTDGLASRPVQITQDYKLLVRKHFREFKKPSAYAEKLNISVTYLNDTVKKVTGFPATGIIQQEIISEAQRELLYTRKSIKEIAYDLGFGDWKYFIRLFSKVAGKSPTAFRKEGQRIRSDVKKQ